MLMEVDGKLACFLNFALIMLDPCSVWLETRNIPSQHETFYSLMHIFNLFPPSLRHILTTSLGRHITDMVSQRQILNFFILIYPCFDSLVYILIFLFSNNPYYPSLLFHSLPRSFTLSVAPFCTCLIGSVTILWPCLSIRWSVTRSFGAVACIIFCVDGSTWSGSWPGCPAPSHAEQGGSQSQALR